MDPAAPNPLLRSFERHLRAENRSNQTVATYLIALRQAETFLAATRGTTLAAAGRADLEAYLGDLLTRRAAATYYKVLKLLYQWLEDEDELPASPMAKMRPPIVPDQPVPVIPDDGLRRLLAAAAIFRPARRRIQAAVDRRFNRRGYNAAKTIQAFSTRLRDQVDLDTLSSELLAVVDQTMEPTRVSVWFPPSPHGSSGTAPRAPRPTPWAY